MPALDYVKSVFPRAVHIRVQPQPRNLHETRTVLRILKDFGDVDSFRSLRNDPIAPAPSTILAVFRNEESAARLIAEAPLQFSVQPRVYEPAGISGLGIFRGSEDSHEKPKVDGLPRGESTRSKPEGKPLPREFYLTAQSSRFDHQAHIRRQEFYWGYKSGDSFSDWALLRTIPVKALSRISSRQNHIPTRIVNKMMDEVMNRKSLTELAKEAAEFGETDKRKDLPRAEASSQSEVSSSRGNKSHLKRERTEKP